MITLLESASHCRGCVMDRLTVGMPWMRWIVVSRGGGGEGGVYDAMDEMDYGE